MPKVVTQLDIDLAKWNLEIQKVKADMQATSQAAREAKLGEKIAESLRKAEVEKAAREAANSYVNTWKQLLAEKDMGAAMQTSVAAEFKSGAQNAARQAAIAAADEWKRIITPAINETWGYHRAGSGGSALGMNPGNARRFAMGNAAMQVQDIAVQAQMGVNPAIILAQQGSQLASIIGPAGMVAGAIAAIGGAFVIAGQKGDETFNKMIEGTRELHEELVKVSTGGGSMSEMLAVLDKITDKQNELLQARKDNAGKGFFSWMAENFSTTFAGGKASWEKEVEARSAGNQAIADEIAGRKAILDLSARELQIATLKSQGKDKEAAALEKQWKIEAEIAKINATHLDAATKKQIIGNLQAAAALPSAGEDKQWEADAEHRRSLAKQFADAERSVAEAGLSDAQKLVALNEDRLRLEREIAAASKDEDKIKLATERERIEAQIVQHQRSLAEKGEQTKKQQDDQEKQRQKSIKELQEEIEVKRVENLPPAERAKAIGDALKETLAAANASDPTLSGLDAALGRATTSEEKERLLKLKKQAQEQELALAGLAPKPETQYQQLGAFGKAAAFFSGQNPNELIAVEAQKQTQQNEDHTKLLSDIKTVLEQIKGKDGKLVVNDARFTP